MLGQQRLHHHKLGEIFLCTQDPKLQELPFNVDTNKPITHRLTVHCSLCLHVMAHQKNDIKPTMVEAELQLRSQYLCYCLSVHKYVTNTVQEVLNETSTCV